MADSTTPVTEKPLMGTLIGVGITVAVIFLAAWAAGKGWKASKNA